MESGYAFVRCCPPDYCHVLACMVLVDGHTRQNLDTREAWRQGTAQCMHVGVDPPQDVGGCASVVLTVFDMWHLT